MKELLAKDRIIFGEDEKKIPELKVPLREVEFPLRSVINLDARKGSNDLEQLFGNRDTFKNPKPVELLELLFSYILPKKRSGFRLLCRIGDYRSRGRPAEFQRLGD